MCVCPQHSPQHVQKHVVSRSSSVSAEGPPGERVQAPNRNNRNGAMSTRTAPQCRVPASVACARSAQPRRAARSPTNCARPPCCDAVCVRSAQMNCNIAHAVYARCHFALLLLHNARTCSKIAFAVWLAIKYISHVYVCACMRVCVLANITVYMAIGMSP